jgi:hypothetical protein
MEEIWQNYGGDEILFNKNIDFRSMRIAFPKRFEARSAPPERASPHPARCFPAHHRIFRGASPSVLCQPLYPGG